METTVTGAGMRAYHNDPELRTRTLAQMQAHRDADQIVQGTYWARGRGCAVGCLTHDPHGGHEQYPARWGIPVVLARLEDRIFERLPEGEAREWPLAFLGAIPIGADLSLVWPRFALAILANEARGVRRLTPEGSEARAGVDRVAGLFRRVIDGTPVTGQEWRAAADAAADAAYAAHAADAYAAYAAHAAAAAAAHAAADAYDADAYDADAYDADAYDADAYDADAYAADAYDADAYAADAYDADDAYAAAYAAACSAHYRWMADTLLVLLAFAPVVG